MSYHWPPKVLITVVNGANISPQPGFARRQIPARSEAGSFSLAAYSAIWSQVGRSGIVIPACSNRSLRYIRNDDSP